MRDGCGCDRRSRRRSAAIARRLDVLAFWRAAGPDKWFNKDPAFDAEIAARFGAIWRAAADGGLHAGRRRRRARSRS